MPKHEPLVFDQKMTVSSEWAHQLTQYDRHIAVDNSHNRWVSFRPGEVRRLRFLGGISVNFTEEFSSDAVPEIAREFRYVDLSLGEDQVRLTTYPQVAREFGGRFRRACPDRNVSDHFSYVRQGFDYETVIFPSSALETYVEPEVEEPAAPRRSIWQRLINS